MSSPSVSYAESVLSHLEKVQQLPLEVQASIARRVESCIKIAGAAKNEAIVANIASSAMEEQAKAIGHGTMDPQWAAPAIVVSTTASGLLIEPFKPGARRANRDRAALE
jgi:hypothetical protein